MFRKSFRKKKPKRESNEEDQVTRDASRTVNKLTNYSEALQLLQTLKAQTHKLRVENEYLKHAVNQTETSLEGNHLESYQFFTGPRAADTQDDANGDSPVVDDRLREQQQRISELENRLKEANEMLAKKDDEQQNMFCHMMAMLDAMLKHMAKDEEISARYDARPDVPSTNTTLEHLNTATEEKDLIDKMQNVYATLTRRDKDTDKKELYNMLHKINGSLERFEKHNHTMDATLEHLRNSNTVHNDDATFKRVQQHLSATQKRCGFLEECLQKEMRKHNDIMMKISKMIAKEHSEVQELVHQIEEFSKDTTSRLTELLELIAASGASHTNDEKLPTHIYGFALQTENEIDHMDTAKKFGLALGLNPDFVEGLSTKGNDPKKLFWTELYEWNHGSDNKHSLSVLIAACQIVGICPFQDGLMPARHSKAIEKAYSRLEADIFVSYVVSHLRDHGVLTVHDVDYILSPSTGRSQFRCLVDILPLFGEKAFDHFVDSLTMSKQEHLARMLLDELEKLNEDEDECQTKETINPPIKDSVKTCSNPEFTPEMDLMELGNRESQIQLLATILTSVHLNKEMLTNLLMLIRKGHLE